MNVWIRIPHIALLAVGMSLLASTAPAQDQEEAIAVECGAALQRGEWDASLAACTQAIDSGRWNGATLAILYNYRGTARSALGQPRDAIVDYDQALAVNPDYARAYFNRGITYCQLGTVDRVVTDITRQWQLAPDEVAADQRMLAASGYYTGGIDGQAGPGTRAALRAWAEGGSQ